MPAKRPGGLQPARPSYFRVFRLEERLCKADGKPLSARYPLVRGKRLSEVQIRRVRRYYFGLWVKPRKAGVSEVCPFKGPSSTKTPRSISRPGFPLPRRTGFHSATCRQRGAFPFIFRWLCSDSRGSIRKYRAYGPLSESRFRRQAPFRRLRAGSRRWPWSSCSRGKPDSACGPPG